MAAGAPRIFVLHLAGVAVFDPSGDQVGRVRDLVAMLRVGRRPPRLLGLVVLLHPANLHFLSMTRVIGIESGQVITTGVLNVRRFEPRPRAARRRTARPAGPARRDPRGGDRARRARPAAAAGREWEIGRVFVRKGRSGTFRRTKGETLTVDWSAVTGLSAGGARTGRREPPRHLRAAARRRPGRTSCTTCRRSGRRPPPWTTTASPTSWRSSPGRPDRDPGQAQGGARRRRPGRWTPTTRPTCSPNCPRTTWSDC